MKNIRVTIKIILLTTLVCVLLLSPRVIATSFAEGATDFTLVGLKYGNSAVATSAFQSQNGLKIANLVGKQITGVTELVNTNSVRALVENGNLSLYGDNNNLLNQGNQVSEFVLLASDYETGGIIYVDNIPYRGGILCKVNANGKINLINWLKTDEYLYGVVHMEMSQANPIEALKAQAVAARNFLCVSRNRHIADGFEVCTTTHCQVYGGYNKEYPSTNQSVDETSGQLIYFNGTPINAYYHKNSGGFTQNSQEVWGGKLDYLSSVKDIYSPDYNWSYYISKNDFETKLKNYGISNIGTIQNVRINALNSTGYVSELIVNGSDGSSILKKENIRAVLGFTNIKSLNFNLNSQPFSFFTMGVDKNNLYNLKDSNVMIANEYQSSQSVSTQNLYVINGSNQITKLTSSTIDDTSNTDTIAFSGKGYGHGVGLSQDGAIQMAKKGFNYVDILKFYYSGVEVR